MDQKDKNIVDVSKTVRHNNTSAKHAYFGPHFLANTPLAHISLFIFLIITAIYSNTLDAPFGWDDDTYIIGNIIVKNLHYFANLSEAIDVEFYSAVVLRYIGYLTFALDYKIYGSSVTGYHVINIAIHIVNTILVYLLVLLTFRTPFFAGNSPDNNSRPPITYSRHIAFFAALLFGVHPVQTAAVTYIFQRFVSLATLFYLVSLTAYIQSRFSDKKQQRFFYYSVAFISAVLAMKTKEIAFTLPLVITLYEFCFFSRPSPGVSFARRFFYLAPLLLTLSIIPLTLVSLTKVHALYNAHEGIEYTRWEYLFTQFRVIVTYLRLLLFPLKPYIDYEYPVFKSFFYPQVLFSFLFLAAFFCLGVSLVVRTRHGHKISSPSLRLVGFGILWFFITLSVESSVMPLFEVINEYRLYLPSIGLIISMVSAIFLLIEKLPAPKARERVVAMILIVAAVLSVATYIRNLAYGDEIGMWEVTAKRYPSRANVHVNLGKLYAGRNMIPKSVEHNLLAIKLNPNNAGSHNNLGNNYRKLGRYDQAIEQYMIAAKIDPDLVEPHFNLGSIYVLIGQKDKARRELTTALKLKPDMQDARKLLDEISR